MSDTATVFSTGQSERLSEYATSANQTLQVDRENGVIHDVKILSLQSKNDGGNRVYDPGAVARAIPLYEGSHVNVDHVSAYESVKYANRIGRLQNVRAAVDGLVADFHFNPRHALAEQLCWDAEHSPSSVGFSHVIEGRKVKRDGKNVVEDILRVLSVDLVANPATTAGLFEEKETAPTQEEGNKSPMDPKDIANITEEQLREHAPALVAKLTGTDEASQHMAEIAKLKEDLAEAQAKITAAELKEAEAAKLAAIQEELKAAGFDQADKAVCSDLFMEQLKAAPDATARKRLIEDRKPMLASVKRPIAVGTGNVFAPVAGSDSSNRLVEFLERK